MTVYYKMILTKIKRLATSDLVKVSSLTAISTVIRMITGFISGKVVAIKLNKDGLALLGQLTNFIAIIQSIASAGINTGVTKYVSEYSDSPKKYLLFLGTSFWITVFFSIISSIVLIAGAGYFSQSILHDQRYTPVFYIFGSTLILYSLNALLMSAINGFKEYKRFVIVSILTSTIGLTFSVVLVFTYGVMGALIGAVTFQSVIFFLSIAIVAKSDWFQWRIFIRRFRKSIAGKLGKFSLMALVSAISIPAGQLIVRNFIISGRSLADAGLWEGINRISLMYLTLITVSLSTYYLPRLAELKTNSEIRTEIFSVYKIVLPLLAVITAAIYLFRSLIIRILFTKDFAPMEDLFAFQLIGDFLKIAGWVLGYLLIAKAMAKTYIIMELVNFVLLVSSSFFLVKNYGAIGATIAYATLYLVYFIVLVIVFRKLLFPTQKI